MRSIFLFLIVIVVFLLVMVVIRGRQQSSFRKQQEQEQKQKSQERQKMVSCEICHTYLPEKEALCQDGKYFCSQKHLEQFADKHGDEN